MLRFRNDSEWDWRLLTQEGHLLHYHEVRLDTRQAEYRAFSDLVNYYQLHSAPSPTVPNQPAIYDRVGRWVTEFVLGEDLSRAIVAHAPATVRIVVPPDAASLTLRPIEAALFDRRPLVLQDVSFVWKVAENTLVAKEATGSTLRMLGLFSLPTDVGALALRRERYALARLISDVAERHGKALELRILQYGVTREHLRTVMEDALGWDILHFSGHGEPGALVLENADGSADIVNTPELIDLVTLARSRLKLVTLSSCSSAAGVAVNMLKGIGLPAPPSPHAPSSQHAAAPALAYELARTVGCSVVAMRYPVGDDLAIALNEHLYEQLLGRGNSVARSMQIALPRALDMASTYGTPPPYSAAIPAIFGHEHADSRMTLPAGPPVRFDQSRLKMAGVPAEPDRFVGRVAQLIRGSAALAPDSGKSGVLFYGMAGAGKSACALELAYRHEDVFRAIVWYKAPDTADTASSLSDFALALEAKLPGLTLVPSLGSYERLRSVLPSLTEFMERNAVLVLIDNVESLLTTTGTWKDSRWSEMLDALVAHHGQGRVILTSRRKIDGLNEAVIVESIAGLSLIETVLLARELPGLSRMMSSDEGRELLRRVIVTLQGHPKLMELANAQTVFETALIKQLEMAERKLTEAGEPTERFLVEGESGVGLETYVDILTQWASDSAEALPWESLLAFEFVCLLEESDRRQVVTEYTWGDYWSTVRENSNPPAWSSALAPVVDAALIAAEGSTGVYRIHPTVARAGQDLAAPEIRRVVDTVIGQFWIEIFNEGQVRNSDAVIREAALAAVPYLMRRGEYASVGALVGFVSDRDTSPGTTSLLSGIVNALKEITAGTDLQDLLDPLVADIESRLYPDQAPALLEGVLKRAEEGEQFGLAVAAARVLAGELMNRGRPAEALSVLETAKERLGPVLDDPWAWLANDGQRLMILASLGRNSEVLHELRQLVDLMKQLPRRRPEVPESEWWRAGSHWWSAAEKIYDAGRLAAANLELWESALELNDKVRVLGAQRKVSPLTGAISAFNDYGPLIGLGRIDDARHTLRECIGVFEGERAVDWLARAYIALATVESSVGSHEEAVGLAERALRYAYASHIDTDSLVVCHSNLATFLHSLFGQYTKSECANRLAAALIAFQVGSARTRVIGVVAEGIAKGGDEFWLPESFGELSGEVARVDGVELRSALEILPPRGRTPDESLMCMIEVAAEAGAQGAPNVDAKLARWRSYIPALASAAGETDVAAPPIGALLDELRPESAGLAASLEAVVRGARDWDFLVRGLDAMASLLVWEVLSSVKDRRDS